LSLRGSPDFIGTTKQSIFIKMSFPRSLSRMSDAIAIPKKSGLDTGVGIKEGKRGEWILAGVYPPRVGQNDM
jgi:hypothetical protein